MSLFARFRLLRLLRQIIKRANGHPHACARQIRFFPSLIDSDPDVLIVVHGRAILIKIRLPEMDAAPDREIDNFDLWQDKAGARCAFIDSIPAAWNLINEVARDQTRLQSYDPRRNL